MKFGITMKYEDLTMPFYFFILASWFVYSLIFLNYKGYWIGFIYIVILNLLCAIRVRRCRKEGRSKK